MPIPLDDLISYDSLDADVTWVRGTCRLPNSAPISLPCSGDFVILHVLKTARHINGMLATLLYFSHELSRWVAKREHGAQVNVKCDNFCILEPRIAACPMGGRCTASATDLMEEELMLPAHCGASGRP